jgi:hypothetical protein
MTRARIQQARLGGDQVCFKCCRYRTAMTWDRHRWVLGKAKHNENGSNPRFVVTNIPSSEEIIDETFHWPLIDGKQLRR